MTCLLSWKLNACVNLSMPLHAVLNRDGFAESGPNGLIRKIGVLRPKTFPLSVHSPLCFLCDVFMLLVCLPIFHYFVLEEKAAANAKHLLKIRIHYMVC